MPKLLVDEVGGARRARPTTEAFVLIVNRGGQELGEGNGEKA